MQRALPTICFNEKTGRQMRFIAGPRQVGKTTLSQKFLHHIHCDALYYNWDLRSVKDRYKSDPYFYNADAIEIQSSPRKWICFDEIHKFPKWKNILKDAFDSFENKYRFIITGSARLDWLKKSGDSLSGRYFLYKLLPISLFELLGHPLPLPHKNASDYIESAMQSRFYDHDMQQLIHFSGFPEPLFKADDVFSSNWHDAYVDTLIRTDVRDLTRIHDVEHVATLLKLLPERIGSPLSLNAIREDMDVSYNALKSYTRALGLAYIIFSVPPYSKKIARAVKKETKVYFFDWSMVRDESKRFENYVACELKNRVELWTMATAHKFELYFIRTRGGQETDFLVTRDNAPYFLVEAKLSSESIDSHTISHARILGDIPLVQVLAKAGVAKAWKNDQYVLSAARFFAG